MGSGEGRLDSSGGIFPFLLGQVFGCHVKLIGACGSLSKGDLELEMGEEAEETVGKGDGGSIEGVIRAWVVSEDCESKYCWGPM
jgi:hypothetical protein